MAQSSNVPEQWDQFTTDMVFGQVPQVHGGRQVISRKADQRTVVWREASSRAEVLSENVIARSAARAMNDGRGRNLAQRRAGRA
jgi:hypothetical protein